ncbi:MAG: glycerophosphodiester phosphodiesterase [Myxococcales bacterium]|nr:glycerophosphodiester phosphodiesterase [Myxococcales bacterium]
MRAVLLERLRRRAGEPPRVYAHRGACRKAPENTLRAIEIALDESADGVEIDVRPCGSGELVLAHDPDLWRVAGLPRAVHETPWSVLRRVDLGGGERVALLEDAISLVAVREALLNVEVKADVPSRLELVRALRRLWERLEPRARDRCWLSTFDPILCVALRRALPEPPCALLFDEAHPIPRVGRWLDVPLRTEGVHPRAPLVRARDLRRWHRAGRFVVTWTVDDPDEARRLASLGVDGIITDEPGRIRAALHDGSPLAH